MHHLINYRLRNLYRAFNHNPFTFIQHLNDFLNNAQLNDCKS